MTAPAGSRRRSETRPQGLHQSLRPIRLAQKVHAFAERPGLVHQQIQAGVVISSAQASAVAAAADEAANTFGTDSVAEQVEYGFAGDVGTLPPMDHRLQGVGISVPKCFNESREGENC